MLLAPPTGSVPATGFLKQSGIHMDSRGFITVNKVAENVHEVDVNSKMFALWENGIDLTFD